MKEFHGVMMIKRGKLAYHTSTYTLYAHHIRDQMYLKVTKLQGLCGLAITHMDVPHIKPYDM